MENERTELLAKLKLTHQYMVRMINLRKKRMSLISQFNELSNQLWDSSYKHHPFPGFFIFLICLGCNAIFDKVFKNLNFLYTMFGDYVIYPKASEFILKNDYSYTAEQIRWYLYDEPLTNDHFNYIQGYTNIMKCWWWIVLFITAIILSVIVTKIVRKIERGKAEQFAASKSEINAYNNQVLEEMSNVDKLRRQTDFNILDTQTALQRDVMPWFPPDYFSMEAVEYFISAVENYSASTIGEAVNQYNMYLREQRAEARHREIVNNQRNIMKRQDAEICLEGVNAFLSAGNIMSTNYNTKAIESYSRAAQQASNAQLSAISNVSAKLDRLR